MHSSLRGQAPEIDGIKAVTLWAFIDETQDGYSWHYVTAVELSPLRACCHLHSLS